VSWERLADLVLRRPRLVLGIALLLLGPPLLALPSLNTSLDQLEELPDSADSVLGVRAVEGSFEPGQVQPTVVILRSEESVWSDEVFAAIDLFTVNLEKIEGVSDVRSITRPTGGRVSEEDLEAVGLGDLADLGERLPAAGEGVGRAIDGLERMRAGLRQIRAGIPQQRAALEDGLDGIAALRDGIDRIRDGVGQIRAGLAEARDGLRRLADEVADPALENLRAAWDDLRDATVARGDAQYADLAEHVGTALALVSGRCPDATGIGPQPEACPAGAKLDPEYEGLAPTLREVASGLDEAIDGLGLIDDGLLGVDQGLAGFEEGLRASLPELERLDDGAARMIRGLDKIIPGLRLLRRGLAVGVARAQEAGLLPDPTGEFGLTASLVEAFPRLREQLEFFVGKDGKTTRLYVILDVEPFAARAIASSNQIEDVGRLSLRDSPLEDGDILVTGTTAFFADVGDISSRDFRRIIWAVVIGILIVLIVLLRSLVAPLYLVLTVLVSFLSTLGLTAFVFQGIIGKAGLVWWLPAFLFVILVALGADYNIFLTGRIREEANRLDTRRAVARGLAATGHVITSAGIILAGTFAALLASPLGGLVQFGFAATAGILIDTFIVRSLLVPSIAVIVGKWSWWPSRRVYAD
jgi:RND superfamily putative drug exporter